ncbi:hypothetical protein Goarm_009594, partial [Gossypium armourianum]|nr:hypothetical protein [Gossypium armourianum]
WKRFVNVKNNLFKTDKWKRFVDVKNNLFKTNKVFEWDDSAALKKKEEVITGWEYDDPTPCLPTIVE